MPAKTVGRADYDRQRKHVTPPHVTLATLRAVSGITIDVLLFRIQEETGLKFTRGHISGIELGHRGASKSILDAICAAYGLPPGSISTTYEPRERRTPATAAKQDVA